jgi:hypothetical protein
MLDWFKRDDIYTQDPLTGEMNGPYRGWTHDAPSNSIPAQVFVPNPFETGFSTPSWGGIELPHGNIILGFIGIIILLVWFNLWMFRILFLFSARSIKCWFYKIKKGAVVYTLLVLFVASILILEFYVIGEFVGINKSIRLNNFINETQQKLEVEIHIPKCNFKDPNCEINNIYVSIYNNSKYSYEFAIYNVDGIPCKLNTYRPSWVIPGTLNSDNCQLDLSKSQEFDAVSTKLNAMKDTANVLIFFWQIGGVTNMSGLWQPIGFYAKVIRDW